MKTDLQSHGVSAGQVMQAHQGSVHETAESVPGMMEKHAPNAGKIKVLLRIGVSRAANRRDRNLLALSRAALNLLDTSPQDRSHGPPHALPMVKARQTTGRVVAAKVLRENDPGVGASPLVLIGRNLQDANLRGIQLLVSSLLAQNPGMPELPGRSRLAENRRERRRGRRRVPHPVLRPGLVLLVPTQPELRKARNRGSGRSPTENLAR